MVGLSLAGVSLASCRPPAAPKAAPEMADPFRDVTAASGLDWVNAPTTRPLRLLESVGFGGGFLDYDRDGDQDIFLTGAPRCGLFRNRGDGTYENTTAEAGLSASGEWIGCAVGDYDNDGYPDLYVTGYGRSALYRNERGRFRDVTRQAGVAMKGKWATAAAFADFDKDGLLDLYVAAYCHFGPESRQYCVLHQNGIKTGCRPIDYDPQIGAGFRNRGGGVFEDRTRQWGLDRAHGKTLGAVVSDYNADGWPDLYLANDEMPADLFRNEGGRRFTEVAAEAGCAFRQGGQLMGGMGADWGDYDNDGTMDLVVSTFESEEKALFRNRDGMSFDFASGPAGILPATYPDVAFGALFFDYDNDGWLDLLFVNGHTMDNIAQVRPGMEYRQPGRLFRNQCDGTFGVVSSPSLAVPIAGRGVACADYDGSGRQSLLVVDMDGRVRLLRNTAGSQHHFLQIRLEGTQSNRGAVGTRVTVTAGGRQQLREAFPNRSYLSVCDERLHFGLGTATRAETVEVRWPSGRTTRLRDVKADQVLHLKESEGSG